MGKWGHEHQCRHCGMGVAYYIGRGGPILAEFGREGVQMHRCEEQGIVASAQWLECICGEPVLLLMDGRKISRSQKVHKCKPKATPTPMPEGVML